MNIFNMTELTFDELVLVYKYKNKDIDEFVYNIKKENNTDIYKLYLVYNKDYKIKLSDAIYQDKKYLYKLINLLKKELKQRKILN
ncbi:hypothetical protein KBH77_04550 [Patescibacteria group bacterium]|nr:hypothetical protein [Patescibacteria group bacterium]